jgi:hydroxymethylbilane synthase
LAVECRTDDQGTREILAALHDINSEHAVTIERKQMAKWGGGCHQRFGISFIQHSTLEGIRFAKGMTAKDDWIKDTILVDAKHLRSEWPNAKGEELWQPPKALRKSLEGILGTLQSELNQHTSIFVSHKAALPDSVSLNAKNVFCAGVDSWRALTQRGVWVNACAEGLGAAYLWQTLKELSFLGVEPWLNLSHQGACSEEYKAFPEEKALGTYTVDYSNQASSLENSRFLYWSSKSQYDSLHMKARKDAYHACGPGKTAVALGKRAKVFFNREEWKGWMNT